MESRQVKDPSILKAQARAAIAKALGEAGDAYMRVAPDQDSFEDYQKALSILRERAFQDHPVVKPPKETPEEEVMNREVDRAWICMPRIGQVEAESRTSALSAASYSQRMMVQPMEQWSSCLALGLNKSWVLCLNDVRKFTHWGIHHADLASTHEHLDILHEEMAKGGYDVMSSYSPIKDERGLSSTAYGSMSNEWKKARRLTFEEIHRQLPMTCGIEELEAALGRFGWGDDPLCLMPNTGMLLMSLARRPITGPGPFRFDRSDPHNLRQMTWPRDFGGFTMLDRINTIEMGLLEAECVSEDWYLGLWAARHGLKVGVTRRVPLVHYGRKAFANDHPWGEQKKDEAFFSRIAIEADLEANGVMPKESSPYEAEKEIERDPAASLVDELLPLPVEE